jgi:hypothetical protein
MTLRCRPRERGDPVFQGVDVLRRRDQHRWLGVYWVPALPPGRQRLGVCKGYLSTQDSRQTGTQDRELSQLLSPRGDEQSLRGDGLSHARVPRPSARTVATATTGARTGHDGLES